MKKLNKKKQVIISFLNLCLTAIILVISVFSFAWFSQNNKVTSGGMTLRLGASSNIIISDDLSSLENIINIRDLNDGDPFVVNMASNFTKFYPCTRDDSGSYKYDLKRVKDEYSQYIDIKTGVTTNTIEYIECDTEELDDKICFNEYTIGIASHGKALVNATLMFSIASATIKDENNVDINLLELADTQAYSSLMAASVDIFEKKDDDSLVFMGTLNVAGLNVNDGNNGFDKGNETYDDTDTKTFIYLIGDENSTGAIPLNTTPLEYVLRVYFDGALLETQNKTYINSSTLDCSKLTLTFNFTATGKDEE